MRQQCCMDFGILAQQWSIGQSVSCRATWDAVSLVWCTLTAAHCCTVCFAVLFECCCMLATHHHTLPLVPERFFWRGSVWEHAGILGVWRTFVKSVAMLRESYAMHVAYENTIAAIAMTLHLVAALVVFSGCVLVGHMAGEAASVRLLVSDHILYSHCDQGCPVHRCSGGVFCIHAVGTHR